MNIPARYCAGYLGYIGASITDAPMDFAAWFEAYVGGEWHTIGRVLIARGRDAADVAITTTFGPNTLTSFTVVTEDVAPEDNCSAIPTARFALR
jgi:transglutaminase-like putative cysteine protease